MINYRGKDEKVLVRFTKAVLPTGREIAVKAQGMIKGDYHEGRPGVPSGGNLGAFRWRPGIGEVLTQKEALSEYGDITPKSTLRNALYHGARQESPKRRPNGRPEKEKKTPTLCYD